MTEDVENPKYVYSLEYEITQTKFGLTNHG